MTDRIIEISQSPARLNARGALLVINPHDGPESTVPFEEIAAVAVANPQVTVTQGALSGLASAGAIFVSCNEKYLPSGMFLPMEAHFTQGERFERQAMASVPLRKRLWRKIVAAKIAAQGRLLNLLYGDEKGLFKLARTVRSGDVDNREAQAAIRYWPSLFQQKDFRRDPGVPDQNRFLNYGYTILRALVARAVCAAGLHPSLGLHHHNRYDSFRLASDLMEPFRPLVDAECVKIVRTHGIRSEFSSENKRRLLGICETRLTWDGESRTLFDALSRSAQGLAAVFEGRARDFSLPEI